MGDVFRCAFLLFVQRLPSLNALEEVLRRRGKPLVLKAVPSADTIGRTYSRMSPEGLRSLLGRMCALGRRNKSLRRRHSSLPWTVAVDGHQLFGSFSRNCDQCQQRKVAVGQSTQTQYHHQIVKAQLVGVEPAFGLDAELLAPKEGERAAAHRLIRRVIQQFPFVRIFTLDALYLAAPLLRMIYRAGRGAIVPLKDKTRDLYKDAQALFATTEPQSGFLDGEPIRYWDIAGFTSMPGLRNVPVRVVRTITTVRVRRRVARQWLESEKTQDWTWAVVGLGPEVSPLAIHRLGHDRWNIENEGFNKEDRFFALDHCFKHDPTAILNFILTLFLATGLSEIFFTRNLKAPLLRQLTLSGLARLLLEEPPDASESPVWPRSRSP